MRLNNFVNKTLSLFHLNKRWMNKACSSFAEAARTTSYIETVDPQRSDTLHRSIKRTDITTLQRSFEIQVRKAIKKLGLRQVKIAIDVTEELYWGENGHVNTRASSKQHHIESWQFLHIAIVEPYSVPLMCVPYRMVDNLTHLTIDVIKFALSLPLKIELFLFDRGFFNGELIDFLEGTKRGKALPYLMLVPRNKVIKNYIEKTLDIGVFDHKIKYRKGNSGFKIKAKFTILRGATKNKKGEPIDWCFCTNQKLLALLISTYLKRWNIETMFRVQDEARIKSKSSSLIIRYFYHLLSLFFILLWRIKRIIKQMVFKRVLKEVQLFYSVLAFELPT